MRNYERFFFNTVITLNGPLLSSPLLSFSVTTNSTVLTNSNHELSKGTYEYQYKDMNIETCLTKQKIKCYHLQM